MNKVEIIEDTVNHYLDDVTRFATNYNGGYNYEGDGKRCAVGRCLDVLPQGLLALRPISDDKTFAVCVFKSKYRDHEQSFWVDIQNLHDTNCYWNKVKKCLTPNGVEYVASIKTKWRA